MESKFNMLAIIGLIGAVLMVIGVFLGWLTAQGLLGAHEYTGMDIINNVDNIASGYKIGSFTVGALSYSFLPLLALICGIIAIVLMLITTFCNNDKLKSINNILGIIVLIMAIIIVIVAILFYTQSWQLFGGSYSLTDKFSVGAGLWLVLAGGIITVIGGIMPVVKNKFMS